METGSGGLVGDGIDVAGEGEVVGGGELHVPVDLLRKERRLRQREIEFAFGGLQGGNSDGEGEFDLGLSTVGGGIIERDLDAIRFAECWAHRIRVDVALKQFRGLGKL